MHKYVAYSLTILATVGVVGSLVRLGGGDFSRSLEFLRDTWLWWLVYAVCSILGYTIWYYVKKSKDNPND